MKNYIAEALKEFNSSLPAWKPVYRFDQLSSWEKSAVVARAEELIQEDDQLLDSVSHIISKSIIAFRPAVVSAVQEEGDLESDEQFYRPRSLPLRRCDSRKLPN